MRYRWASAGSYRITGFIPTSPVLLQMNNELPPPRRRRPKLRRLVLPGAVMNPDSLRMQPKAVEFVRSFFDSGKPVGAICHGPWTIVGSGAAGGLRMTSWPSLKTDILNAGGEWLDQEVVVHDNLVTSRKPDDLPAFNREILKMFGESRPGSGSA